MVYHAHAVGPEQPGAAYPDELGKFDFVAHAGGIADAGGDDHEAASACVEALLDLQPDVAGRRRHHDQLGCLGKIGQ